MSVSMKLEDVLIPAARPALRLVSLPWVRPTPMLPSIVTCAAARPGTARAPATATAISFCFIEDFSSVYEYSAAWAAGPRRVGLRTEPGRSLASAPLQAQRESPFLP